MWGSGCAGIESRKVSEALFHNRFALAHQFQPDSEAKGSMGAVLFLLVGSPRSKSGTGPEKDPCAHCPGWQESHQCPYVELIGLSTFISRFLTA